MVYQLHLINPLAFYTERDSSEVMFHFCVSLRKSLSLLVFSFLIYRELITSTFEGYCINCQIIYKTSCSAET